MGSGFVGWSRKSESRAARGEISFAGRGRKLERRMGHRGGFIFFSMGEIAADSFVDGNIPGEKENDAGERQTL